MAMPMRNTKRLMRRYLIDRRAVSLKFADLEVFAEDLFTDHPGVLGKGADGADPAAEALFHDQRNSQDRREHDKPRRMHRLHIAGHDEVLEGHEPADGKEGVHGRRPLHKGTARHNEVLDELVEAVADEKSDCEKGELHRVAKESDVFSFCMHDHILSDEQRSRYDMHHRDHRQHAHDD